MAINNASANTRAVECVLGFDQPPENPRIGQRVLVRFGNAKGSTTANPKD